MNNAPGMDTYEDVVELSREIDDKYENGEPDEVLALIIKRAPRRIEREQGRISDPNNSWMRCLRTDLNDIQGFLNYRESFGTIPHDLYERVSGRIKEIISAGESYNLVHPLPENIKAEFIKKLESLLP